MNEIFDILNTKNIFCKTRTRKAVSQENLPLLEEKIDYFIKYIESLEVEVPIKFKRASKNREQNVNKEQGM